MSSNSKMVKRQSPVPISNGKQVEIGSSERGTEEDELGEGEPEKKDSLSVTSQLRIKSIQKLDKEVVLRRIRNRKRMNKVRSAVGAFLFSTNTNTTDASTQGNKWLDDAFTAF